MLLGACYTSDQKTIVKPVISRLHPMEYLVKENRRKICGAYKEVITIQVIAPGDSVDLRRSSHGTTKSFRNFTTPSSLAHHATRQWRLHKILREVPAGPRNGDDDTPDAADYGTAKVADIFSPLPMSPSGNRYTLIMIDHVFRWPEAVRVPDHTGETTARAFVSNVATEFDVPETIITD